MRECRALFDDLDDAGAAPVRPVPASRTIVVTAYPDPTHAGRVSADDGLVYDTTRRDKAESPRGDHNSDQFLLHRPFAIQAAFQRDHHPRRPRRGSAVRARGPHA